MKKFYLLVNTLLIVLLMVGCNSSNVVITSDTQDFNLDGKYYAKEIYHVLNNGENSSSIIDIKDNKIYDCEIKETSLQWDFSVVINDSTALSYTKDTKCYYAELNAKDDYRYGYYIFNQDKMYLFGANCSKKYGYNVIFGVELSDVNEYLNKDHYYIYRNGYGSTAFDESGFNTESLELINTNEQLYEYCEKYIFINPNLVVESYIKQLNQMDSNFFEKYAIVIYSTEINVDYSLLVDSIKVDSTKLTINMNRIVPDYFVAQVVRPWSTIIVIEKSILNGVEDVVVDRVMDVE